MSLIVIEVEVALLSYTNCICIEPQSVCNNNSNCSVVITVDTSGAGDGELAVEVIYMGRMIATQLSQQGSHYRAAFLPEGSGVYNVYVYFNRMDVPGVNH